jgi:isopentenyl-diphosphate delta-isomerase type 1
MNDEIILIDEQDHEIGYGDKLEVHQKELLHRAFSIFIFDWTDYKMLIQKRAGGKYHSGGLWTNACCSHPRKGETMDECLCQRLKEELGIDLTFHVTDPDTCALLLDGSDVIYSCGSFQYFAKFDSLSENELDHVFLYSPTYDGFSKNDFVPNPDEIDEIQWITIPELQIWMQEKPEEFTAWFPPAFELAHEVLCRQARNLDMFLSGVQ